MSHSATVVTVRALLADVFGQVDAWFDRPADERRFRPASGGWTIDQILEHISLTNHFLLITWRKAVATALRRAEEGEPIPEGEVDLQRLQAIGERGSFAWAHPEHMEPCGETPAEEVRAHLRGQLDECLALLARIGHGEGALVRLHMSVNGLGRIDLYQWLYFLAQHARRHLQGLAAIEDEFGSAPTPRHPPQ
jgi:hypothetical protein